MIKPDSVLLPDAEIARLWDELARAEADLARAQLAKSRAEAALVAVRAGMRLSTRWREVPAVAVPIALWASAAAWFTRVWL